MILTSLLQWLTLILTGPQFQGIVRVRQSLCRSILADGNNPIGMVPSPLPLQAVRHSEEMTRNLSHPIPAATAAE